MNPYVDEMSWPIPSWEKELVWNIFLRFQLIFNYDILDLNESANYQQKMQFKRKKRCEEFTSVISQAGFSSILWRMLTSKGIISNLISHLISFMEF